MNQNSEACSSLSELNHVYYWEEIRPLITTVSTVHGTPNGRREVEVEVEVGDNEA